MRDYTEHSPERLKAAVHSACNTDERNCRWPDCVCRMFPACVRAAINSWEAFGNEQSDQRKGE